MWNKRLCVITHKAIHFFAEEENNLIVRKSIKLQDCLFKLVRVGKEEGNTELLSIGEKKNVGHGFLMGVLEADSSAILCWEEVLKTCTKRANQVQWTNYETLKLYDIAKIEKKEEIKRSSMISTNNIVVPPPEDDTNTKNNRLSIFTKSSVKDLRSLKPLKSGWLLKKSRKKKNGLNSGSF